MHLYEFGSASFSEIMSRVRASRNTAGNALGALVARDVVCTFVDPNDRRTKRYELASGANAHLNQGYSAMAKWFGNRQNVSAGGGPHLTAMINDLEKTLGFPCFSPQYEILSILFDAPGLSNKAVQYACNSSRSHFHKSLNTFLANGKVVKDSSARDRRVSAYRLADRVVASLNKNFSNSHKWFEERLLHNDGIVT
jgi:DNA-binding MarR family transcriptional regulator